MKLRFYGLLHLCEEEGSVENLLVTNFFDKLAVYVNCAMTLSLSLQSKGVEFTLLTNRKNIVESLCKNKKGALCIEEISFETEVPRGVKFYSAHFKLDVFRHLSSLNYDYVGLCDLDMVCLNEIPSCLYRNAEQKIPMCYDITDQVIPAYGPVVITRSLELINGLQTEGRWTGGEFISGPPEFFEKLTKKIDHVYHNYINNLESMHHIGDEAVTSAALEIIRKEGTYVADAGTLGIVGRFWNARTLHHQKPFEYFQNCFLLHLPADKRFLSDISREGEMAKHTFFQLYDNYRVGKSPTKLIKKGIRRIIEILMPNNTSQR